MFEEIKGCELISTVEESKVNGLVESFLENGWNGAPILFCKSLQALVTGSHRLAALISLEENYDDYTEEQQEVIDELFDAVEAIDVTDIIDDYCESNEVAFDNIDFSTLGLVFEGTEIEQYADEIEW